MPLPSPRMRAIQISEFGGPEVLKPVELPRPEPAPGEVLIRVTKAGINFADTHTRTNSYVRKATLPLVPGGEVAGVREDTGERVVALTGAGGYAEYAVAPAAHVFAIPEGVDDGTALALLVQGTTAWHLYRTAGHIGQGALGDGGDEKRGAKGEGSGETVVVHAAAGGVGSLAVQLGRPARRRPRDRDRVERGEARAGAATGRRRGDRPCARGPHRAAAGGERGQAGGRGVRDGGRRGVRRLLPGARAVRAAGGVRDRLAAAQPGAQRIAAASLARGRGLLHLPLPAAPGHVRAGAGGPVRARGGEPAHPRLEVVVGHTYPLEQAPQAHIDLRERRTTGKLLLDPSA